MKNQWRNANVLITGGLGFIGSNLAKRLVECEAKVTVVDSLIPEYGGCLFNVQPFESKIKINISDVRDAHSFRHLIQKQDFLFNLAGQVSHLDSVTDPITDLEINCKAQLVILEACRKTNPSIQIVYTSTRQIYGKPIALPVNESHPIGPKDVNGIHKAAGEWYHSLYHQIYDLKACSLRLTNTYGPRMRICDNRQTFVGFWIRSVLEEKPIEVWGGDQIRDFTFVDDVVDALLLAATTPKANGQVYNLGGTEQINLRDLAALMIDVAGCGESITKAFPPERARIDIGSYAGDFSRFKAETGWSPQVDLQSGLSQTLSYYREYMKHYV